MVVEKEGPSQVLGQRHLLLGTEGHLLLSDYLAEEAHCPFVY